MKVCIFTNYHFHKNNLNFILNYIELLKERNDIEAKHQNEKKNLKLAQVENVSETHLFII